MRRLTITIPVDAAGELVRLAQAQRRDPRAQAAVLLTAVLRDGGHLDDRGPAPASRRGGPSAARPPAET